MALNKNVAKSIKTRQENELRENNKLIAEFMGLVKSSYRNMYWTEKSKEGFGEGELVNLLYHTSWDWLMPVVDRIEGIIDEHGCAKYNVRVEQSWVDIIDNHTSDEIVKVDGDNRREATYKAVVEFIKWYNEQDTLTDDDKTRIEEGLDHKG